MKRTEYVVYYGVIRHEGKHFGTFHSEKMADSVLAKYGYIFDEAAGMYLHKTDKMWAKIKELEVS